jgi:hypothetical protein
VPWIKLSILRSITSWTRETGKTPLFASESLVKSDGGGLSDFATGPSPFPDTPWQEAQDRRNSFRPGFSSGCACRTSIVPIIAEAAIKISTTSFACRYAPCVFARSNRARSLPRNTNPVRRLLSVQPLQDSRLNSNLPRAHAFAVRRQEAVLRHHDDEKHASQATSGASQAKHRPGKRHHRPRLMKPKTTAKIRRNRIGTIACR